jgi:regulator-associated protein of mTOR
MWIGSPSIFVFDCSAAGLVLHWFNKFSEQREAEAEVHSMRNSHLTTKATRPSPTLHQNEQGAYTFGSLWSE